MDFTLNISPKLIKSVVSIYNDPNRVFLEYIDNSIDNADEFFFDKEKNSYSRPIEIKVRFLGTTYKDSILKIEDNCAGIKDITKITGSLGNSDKANNSSLNGTFGFGMHSAWSICNNLKIASKIATSPEIKTIDLRSEIFDKSKTEEVNLGMVLIALSNSGLSWTTVTMKDFIKDKFKEFTVEELKQEIEKHFESILNRGNLQITIQKNANAPVVCKPFDYDEFAGPVFKKEITELEYTHSKKYQSIKTIDIEKSPVKIYLKVTSDKVIGRRPYFVVNGRRIVDVADTVSFRTNSKALVWSHASVTGYIDVTGILEPTIARNEFKNTRYSKALFQTLLKYENEIKAFVEEHVNKNVAGQFHRLESILSQALGDLTKEINKKERKALKEGKDKIKTVDSEEGDEMVKSFSVSTSDESNSNDNLTDGQKKSIDKRNQNAQDFAQEAGRRSQNVHGSAPDEAKKITTLDLPLQVKNSRHYNNSKYSDSFGFNILIDDENEPIKDLYDRFLRSVLFQSNIVIYKRHEEFKKRLDDTIHGIPRISPSLVTYLCCEILLHYKCSKSEINESKDKKFLFNDFLESMYYLENKLSWLKNKKLSDFS